VFRGSTMQALWRMRPHASRSATAPGSLPISEVPALLLRTATTLGGANVVSLRRQWSELPPRSQSHVLASGAESGGARRISTSDRNIFRIPACRQARNDRSLPLARASHATFVLVRCPLDLVVRKPQSLQFHTVWLCCGRRLAISFRWLRQRRDPGLFCFPELGIPHTFECPL